MPSTRPTIRVLCVDDLPDVGAVMRLLLDAEPDIQCVGVLTGADHLLDEVRRLEPDVLVVDATMPGKDPLRAVSELQAACPDVAALMYSGYDHPEMIERAVDAGAWGWLAKHESPEELIRAVRQIAAGNTYFPSGRQTQE